MQRKVLSRVKGIHYQLTGPAIAPGRHSIMVIGTTDSNLVPF